MTAAPRPRETTQTEIAGTPWLLLNDVAMERGLAWIEACLSTSATADSLRQSYEAARQDMQKAGEPAAIDQVSSRLLLSPFDEDLLLLLFSFQRTARPQQATAQLAISALAGISMEAVNRAWDRFSPQAPLRRFHLIDHPDRPLAATSPLLIDQRMSRYLMGDDSLDTKLASVVRAIQAGPCPKLHLAPLQRLMEKMTVVGRPAALIFGPSHSGRHATAVVLAGGFGLGAMEVKLRALDAAGELVPVLAREAALGGFAVVVDISDTERQAIFEQHFRTFDGMVVALAEARPDLPFEIPTLRLEPLDTLARVELWHDVLGPHPAEMLPLIEALAEQFKFGPAEISAVAEDGGDLWQACRDRAGRVLEHLADRIVPHYTWDDIVLPAETVHDLQAAAAQVRHRTLVYGEHGFARKLVRGRGISVLLAGPSGAGKTMAAEVIANDLKLDLFRIDLSSVVSKYIGETEKNLRAVFDAAEASGAILFFDEADALFGKRSEVRDSHDRYANIEVSYLLQRMENYGGLAILATNMKGHLDTAFLRRIRFAIDIPFPDAAARRQIWIKFFPADMPRADLDYDALARLDISGGNISVIAVNAAFLAAADATPLSMRHIARAAKAEFRKLDKELRFNWFEGGLP